MFREIVQLNLYDDAFWQFVILFSLFFLADGPIHVRKKEGDYGKRNISWEWPEATFEDIVT